jgi:hypothetical protein
MPNASSQAPPSPAPLNGALGRSRISVLVLLGLCVVAIVAGGTEGEEPPPDRLLSSIGVGLGLCAIVLRRFAGSPAIALRSAVFLSLGSLLASAGLGALGVFMAFDRAAPETGLLFVLAGVIFALRPAAAVAPRRGR